MLSINATALVVFAIVWILVLILTRIFGAEALEAVVTPEIRRAWTDDETSAWLRRRWGLKVPARRRRARG